MPENDTGSGVRIVFLVAVMAFTRQFDAALVTALLLDMACELRATPGGVSVAMLGYLMGAVVSFASAGKPGDRGGLGNVRLVGCILTTTGTIL